MTQTDAPMTIDLFWIRGQDWHLRPSQTRVYKLQGHKANPVDDHCISIECFNIYNNINCLTFISIMWTDMYIEH